MKKFITILLVNQNQAEASVVKGMLIYGLAPLDFQTSVKVATNAENALEQLKSDKTFDLVITDLVFPTTGGGETMSGCELLKEVRASYPDLPVLAFSAYYVRQTDAIRARFDSLHFKDGNYLGLPSAIGRIMKTKMSLS